MSCHADHKANTLDIKGIDVVTHPEMKEYLGLSMPQFMAGCLASFSSVQLRTAVEFYYFDQQENVLYNG